MRNRKNHGYIANHEKDNVQVLPTVPLTPEDLRLDSPRVNLIGNILIFKALLRTATVLHQNLRSEFEVDVGAMAVGKKPVGSFH